MEAFIVVAAAVAAVLAGVCWLRVAQREHYLPGSVLRFYRRWWERDRLSLNLWIVSVVTAILSWFGPAAGLVSAAIVAFGPPGLSVRGRTSKLAWTRRMRTLAATAVAIDVVIIALGLATGVAGPLAVTLAVAQPLVVEAALFLTAPFERRLARRYVDRAVARLRQVRPTIVAITGSYGKTTTKLYVLHLLRSSRAVVASPASFNNTAGLARAVNEHLAPGTEVFVAEMGTYGPGEIREMCGWVRPDVAVITAIGPVHLERMGSIENIVKAKAEILEGAEKAVLNIDAPGLAALADRADTVRCSTTDRSADVWVGPGAVRAQGRDYAAQLPDARHSNIACAIGVAVALDAPIDAVLAQLPTLPVAEHRQQLATSAKGVTVVDDTYNANPAGAEAALDRLCRVAGEGGRRVVITPGMVELGTLQHAENKAFAEKAAQAATHLLIVGTTNRKALLEGAAQGGAEVVLVNTRDEAVAWVREHLGPGDAVLYENDLPDHYP